MSHKPVPRFRCLAQDQVDRINPQGRLDTVLFEKTLFELPDDSDLLFQKKGENGSSDIINKSFKCTIIRLLLVKLPLIYLIHRASASTPSWLLWLHHIMGGACLASPFGEGGFRVFLS